MQAISLLKQKLQQLSNNTAQEPYLYLEQATDPQDLLLWLKNQPQQIKMYWRDKCEDLEVAMIGACHHVESVNCPSRLAQATYFGGVGFQEQTATWPNFGYCRFVLPRLELRHVTKAGKSHYSFRCHLDFRQHTLQEEITSTLALLNEVDAAISDAMADAPISSEINIKTRTDSPNEQQWDALVQSAIDAQNNSLFSKVVLSRQTLLTFENDIDAWQLLSQWQKINSNCYQFAFQFDSSHCFVGCSPERLFMRTGVQLTTEALAGTVVRGGTHEQDQQLAQLLQDDPKIIRENTFVSTDILSRLQNLCKNVGVNDLSIVKLKNIQHLKQRIHAELYDYVDDDTLLSELHPTPAVGGYSRKEALAFILENEPYQRGWYAGAVGYISQQQSEFSVAIRSALIQNNNVSLYAGAGIVQGSESTLEWQELNNKISTVLSLLS